MRELKEKEEEVFKLQDRIIHTEEEKKMAIISQGSLSFQNAHYKYPENYAENVLASVSIHLCRSLHFLGFLGYIHFFMGDY